MDDAFDMTLREAIRQEAYGPPVLLRTGALRARLAADERHRRARRALSATIAAFVGITAVAVIVIRPLATFAPGDSGAPPGGCSTSAPTQHGSWWIEVGGPGAFFNVEPGTLHAGPNPWPIITRLDPDAEPGQEIGIRAEQVGSGEKIAGALNSRMDPGAIYRFSERAPALPGGWYLFEQRFPSAGCWRLSAVIDNQVVGSAVIEIRDGPPPVATNSPPASLQPTDQPAPSPRGWEPLPPSPLAPRTNALAFWTGSEVLVLGGEPETWCHPGSDCAAPRFAPLADGAAFDPVAGSWRSIATAPLAFADNVSAEVVDGDLYVLVYGSPDQPGDGRGFLRYRIADDRWERLPSPAAEVDRYRLVGAGKGVVAYTGSDETGARPDLIFDPTTRTWAELPTDPLSPSFDRSMTVAGGGLYLFAKDLVANPGSEKPSLARGARFDMDTGTWEMRSTSEMIGGWTPVSVGSLIVFPWLGEADGGQVNNWGRSYPYGGIYDTATDTWSPLPQPPGGTFEVAGVIGADGTEYWSATGAVLDLARRSWMAVPSLQGGVGVTSNRAVVAAGTDMFAFGGETWTDTKGIVIGQAYRWTPSR